MRIPTTTNSGFATQLGGDRFVISDSKPPDLFAFTLPEADADDPIGGHWAETNAPTGVGQELGLPSVIRTTFEGRETLELVVWERGITPIGSPLRSIWRYYRRPDGFWRHAPQSSNHPELPDHVGEPGDYTEHSPRDTRDGPAFIEPRPRSFEVVTPMERATTGEAGLGYYRRDMALPESRWRFERIAGSQEFDAAALMYDLVHRRRVIAARRHESLHLFVSDGGWHEVTTPTTHAVAGRPALLHEVVRFSVRQWWFDYRGGDYILATPLANGGIQLYRLPGGDLTKRWHPAGDVIAADRLWRDSSLLQYRRVRWTFREWVTGAVVGRPELYAHRADTGVATVFRLGTTPPAERGWRTYHIPRPHK